MTLEVYATNDRAIYVYENISFTVVGQIPKWARMPDGFVDYLIMAKDISA